MNSTFEYIFANIFWKFKGKKCKFVALKFLKNGRITR